MSVQHSWSKQNFAKPQFHVYSFFSGLRVQHVEVELARLTRTTPVLRLWDRERSSGFQCWLACFQQTSLNVGYQIKVSRAHTAGSGWFKREKKSSEPFPGILQFGAAFWPTTWLPCWMVASFVESESQQHFNVTRPQTNSDSVCVSLCAGQVVFDTVHLLVEWTCASTKCKTGQEVSSARRLAVLVLGASETVVNRVCTRQNTRHGQWLCNEKAIAVLARRRSEILERCSKLF